MARPKVKSPRKRLVNFRLTDTEYSEMQRSAEVAGYDSLSSYLRHLYDNHRNVSQAKEDSEIYGVAQPEIYRETQYGEIYHGDSLGLLHATLAPNSVDLVMTSPPFGLVRKKIYGNEDADRYVQWFRPFAEGMQRVLKDKGSLVIDIGGAWNPRAPTRSLYHFELLIALCRDYGFHLCQEHYWWNPAKLPTPVEWVNVRRIRVKDAVNCVWWLSKTPWPKASNKRILAPYSNSMKSLLKNGYKPKLRPSGHDISNKFEKDNGGSVPPNLLAIANTESNGAYQDYCRANNLPVHPARFPARLPEYFIRMLTDEGDLVVDPFGGSCVTGEVAESLRRKWICCELNEDYLKGALSRFVGLKPRLSKTDNTPYQVYPPCSLNGSTDTSPFPKDGGFKRAPKKPTQKSLRLF
ncbi:MAG: site-specific DNA-methyltransferase [Nitrospira sp.]|nr:site-specific DNA-methyltransferase [Nitrospira sp.]MDE0487253.1 site-specific DNA-methyltransferase [Nitrospira sp.]